MGSSLYLAFGIVSLLAGGVALYVAHRKLEVTIHIIHDGQVTHHGQITHEVNQLPTGVSITSTTPEVTFAPSEGVQMYPPLAKKIEEQKEVETPKIPRRPRDTIPEVY